MRKGLVIVIIAILSLVLIVYGVFFRTKPGENTLTVSGRVEANETDLSSLIPGRLTKVLIDDGMKVRKGDTVALIEDDDLRSKERELKAREEELIERIRAAEFDLSYSESSVKHSIEEARKSLAVAEAKLRQTVAKKENAEKELTRYSRLREKEAASEERYDSVRLAYKVAVEDANTASEEVDKARVSLRKAEDSKDLVKAKEGNLLAHRKALNQVREGLTQAGIALGYTRIIAPVDGMVLRKVAEPGEVLPLGGVVGVMIDPKTLYVRTYVPESSVGRLRMNMEAEIFTDAYPGQPTKGFVCFISDKAEFTPKEVQSYEERVKQVFAVKICFSETAVSSGKAYYEVLKKGMPVDVRFNFQGRQ